MSVVAARMLVDQLCGAGGIPLLVLHDFDKSGFSILGTLCRDNRRYSFKYNVNVIDLGLRLDDVQACGLEEEGVHVTDTDSARDTLERNGATRQEIDFLMDGWRVEMNAFDSRGLVNWLEGRLRECGVEKVIPGDGMLADAYRSAYVREYVRKAIPGLVEEASGQINRDCLPADLRARVERLINKDPATSWDLAVTRVARKAARR
jgi:hypothetical protein